MIIAEDSDMQWILEDDEFNEEKICDDLDTLNINNSSQREVYDEVPDTYYSILCIDVGVVNLGLSALIGNPKTLKFDRVVGIDLLDITKIPHPHDIPECQCTLNHSKTFTDWMEHIFQYYHDVFESVDKIVIERQPPMGFVVVEQLIYSKYRSKCELISPASMHKFFEIRGDYEQRKEQSIAIGTRYLEQNSQIYQEFVNFSRKHDITDSILIGIFWFYKQNKTYLEMEYKLYIDNLIIKTNSYGGCPSEMNIDDFLEQFRYKSPQYNSSLFVKSFTSG